MTHKIDDRQPALFPGLQQTVSPDYRKTMSLRERFAIFHARNPHVYEALRSLALRMRHKGIKRYSIAGLFEILRYDYTMQTQGDEFKLSNSHRAFYARLLMEQEPQLEGFFELRTQEDEADPSFFENLAVSRATRHTHAREAQRR